MTDPQIERAAQVLYPLLYEHAPAIKITDADQNGPFAEPIKTLIAFHSDVAELSAKTGKLYDAWEDSRSIWEGMRASDDGTKRYGLLDQEIRRIATALDNGQSVPLAPVVPSKPTNGNGTIYTTIPTIPIDTNDLLAIERRPVKWFAPSFLREGLGLLVGLPQVGKTPLAIQLAIAIATGTKWMGRVQCQQAKVLFLGVEYTQQEIIPLLDISRCGMDIPRGQLVWKTMEDEFPRETEAALTELEWYIRVLGVGVIIIDVLTAFLPPEKFKQNQYRGDYTELKPYHRLASLHQAAILGTWHGSKRETDPRIMYNGGVGLWAVPASRMSLYTDQENRVRISSFPRMEDRVDWALTQEKTNGGRKWIVADAAPEPLMSEVERIIWRWLKANADMANAKQPATIADMTSVPYNTVKGTLRRMFDKNLIHQGTGGGYYVERVTDVTDVTVVTDVSDVTSHELQNIPHSDASNSPGYNSYTDSSGTASYTQISPNDMAEYEEIEGIFAKVPPSKRTTLRLRLRSNSEADQEVAKERCKEYGIDYEQARKSVQ